MSRESVRGRRVGVATPRYPPVRRRPANRYGRAPGAPLRWGAASHDLEVALRSPGSVGVPAYGANSSCPWAASHASRTACGVRRETGSSKRPAISTR